MRRTHPKPGAAILAACFALGMAAAPAAARDPLGSSARGWLATRFGGDPAAYRPVGSATARIAGGRATVSAAKYLDTASNEIRTVFAGPGGALMDGAAIRSHEAAILRRLPAVWRKADGALRASLSIATPVTRIPVAIWVAADPGAAMARVRARYPAVRWTDGLPDTRDAALVDEIRAAIYREKRAAYRSAQAPIVAAVRAHGGQVVFSAGAAPLLFARLTPTAITALAQRGDVVGQDLDSAGWTPTMASAGPTVQADWHAGTLDQGTGIRVAVVEYHNVRATGDLAGKVVYSWGTTGVNTAGSHPTWVAGAIASQNRRNRGVAPGALIVSTSTGGNARGVTHDSDVIRAAERAIDPDFGNADIVSASFVQDSPAGHTAARAYFDAIAFDALRLPVAAAGNKGVGNYGGYRDGYYVGSPGVGWNVLTVGGIDDRQDARLANDRIWYTPRAGSSFRERTDVAYNSHGDFNKPNVSAPAVGVTTANGLSGTGTSAAAPIVAGIAAQLMARVPSLRVRPHLVEAIIMAGAVHHTRLPNGTVSRDHEGVGTVSAWWANRSLVEGGGPNGGFVFGETSTADPIVRQFGVSAGQKVRVALAWQSHAGGGDILASADVLTADFDLVVTYPGGRRVSASFDNAYEFVEFTAPTSGTATATISLRRIDAASERWALAWTKGF